MYINTGCKRNANQAQETYANILYLYKYTLLYYYDCRVNKINIKTEKCEGVILCVLCYKDKKICDDFTIWNEK